MLLDICLGTRTAWKIVFVLSEAPGKAVSRKEIRNLTRLGNKVITKFLLVLEMFGVIIVHKIGRGYYYKLNMNDAFARQLLEIVKLEKHELQSLDFVVLNILRDFVYELTNIGIDNLHKVILFGSYAKRTFTSHSDIDVALLLEEKNPNDELLITEVVHRLNKRYNKEIQPHYYSLGEFEDLKKKDRLVQEIVKDGIVLV